MHEKYTDELEKIDTTMQTENIGENEIGHRLDPVTDSKQALNIEITSEVRENKKLYNITKQNLVN